MIKNLHARISYRDILLSSIPRLVEALYYAHRMEKAKVPLKNRTKILARWKPWNYALRKEMQRLVEDIRQ